MIMNEKIEYYEHNVNNTTPNIQNSYKRFFLYGRPHFFNLGEQNTRH